MWSIGAQCQCNQLVLAARAAFDRHATGGFVRQKLEIRQRDAKIEIGFVGCERAISGNFAQLVADAKIARRKPLCASCDSTAQLNIAVKNIVDRFRAGAHILCVAIQHKVKRTADRAKIA